MEKRRFGFETVRRLELRRKSETVLIRQGYMLVNLRVVELYVVDRFKNL